MPSRYYFQDARVSGPLEFLAGFGRRRQEVRDMNAALQSRQNEMIGRGAAGVVSGFMGEMAHDRRLQQQVQAEAQQLARKQQMLLSLEQARQQGRIDEQQLEGIQRKHLLDRATFIEKHGTTPEAMIQGGQAQPPQAPQPQPQPGAGQMGQLGGMTIMQGGVPSADGEQTSAGWRTANEEVQKIQRAMALIEGDPGMAPAEKAAAIGELSKQLAPWVKARARAGAPKKQTLASGVQSGQLAWTDPATGIMYRSKDIQVEFPRVTQRDVVSMPPDKREEYIRASFVGDYDRFISDGGWGYIAEDGEVKFEMPGKGKGGGARDFRDEYDDAYAVVAKSLPQFTTGPDGKPKAREGGPSIDETMGYWRQRERGAMAMELEAEKSEGGQALLRRKDELEAMYRDGTLLPGYVEQWFRNTIQLYGKDTDIWPEDIRVAGAKLRAWAWESGGYVKQPLMVAPND